MKEAKIIDLFLSFQVFQANMITDRLMYLKANLGIQMQLPCICPSSNMTADQFLKHKF